ncbi:hypothetical protein FOL47_004897 [Perkinsus chesapeaki]|uniref:Amino acid transporter transmembrane domain-containing protein n=1 Tax=Perkinsus chesapeaki TaxID=330153 RepID=A0A7J6M012_PERCH|nr:hypothetical protein FOL47_004897 [Perkinsus chesapeaki]
MMHDNPANSVDTIKPPITESSLHVGRCSDVRAVFSLALSAVGLGVVMLPSVFATCGWVGGALVLTLAVNFAGFSVTKLYFGIALSPNGPIYTYEDLGRACFGTFGRLFTATVVHVTMTGACASLLVILGSTTGKLLPMLSQRLWMALWGVFFIPFTFLRTMHEVSYVAAVGMVAITCLFLIISINGIYHKVVSNDIVEYDIFVPNILELATKFGVCILSFNVTNSVATLVRDMAKPTHFVAVSRWAYGIIYIVYISIGVCGYVGYGRRLAHETILDSLVPLHMENADPWAYVTLVAIVSTSVPHYQVIVLPIMASAEYALKIDVDDNSWSALFKRFAARVGIILCTVIIAVLVPNLSSLLDLLGSFTMVLMVAVMPCTYYYRVQQLRYGSLRKYVLANRLEFGLILVVLTWCLPMIIVGSYGAIVNFISVTSSA